MTVDLFFWLALLIAVGGYFVLRRRSFSRAGGAFQSVLLVLLVAGSIFVAFMAVANGVWWAIAWQVGIGYIVWRGGRSLMNALIAGFVIPAAAFIVFGFIVGPETAMRMDGYMVAVGALIVAGVALAANWNSVS